VTVAKSWADDLSTKQPSRSERAAMDAVPIDERTKCVRAFNEQYAVVLLGDRPAILFEGLDAENRPNVRLLSVTGFQEWVRPEKVWWNERPVAASKIWLESHDRRQYQGLEFAPSGHVPPNYYNLWKGFAVEPNPSGSCQRFLDHVFENVCQGNERHFSWVMGWFAQMIQDPQTKLGTSLVFRGPQGTGKSIVGDEIGKLLGRHYRPVASERFVTSRFNSHLADCLLLQLEEATWGGDHAAAGMLKDLITGTHQLIEYKGKEPVRVRSYVRVHITSNNEWVVPAGGEERRFSVLDVGEHQIQNTPYFVKIRKEMAAGGSGALLHYLQTLDLSDIPLHQVLETTALRDQKMASMRPEMLWWLDILHSGSLPGDRVAEGAVSVDTLYQNYLEHAKRRSTRHPMSSVQLGIFLHDIAPGVLHTRARAVDQMTGKRPYRYEFPELGECRWMFDRRIRSAVEWPDPKAKWSDSS